MLDDQLLVAGAARGEGDLVEEVLLAVVGQVGGEGLQEVPVALDEFVGLDVGLEEEGGGGAVGAEVSADLFSRFGFDDLGDRGAVDAELAQAVLGRRRVDVGAEAERRRRAVGREDEHELLVLGVQPQAHALAVVAAQAVEVEGDEQELAPLKAVSHCEAPPAVHRRRDRPG
nr:hypothetical protein GCM10025732_58820 [Glycomyces mayteni]